MLTVTNENGCVSEDYVYLDVIVLDELIIYNVITPNGDGLNDTWFIEGLRSLSAYNIKVLHRDGTLVFESEDYNNDWDGVYRNSILPIGPYYYIIEIKPGIDNNSGSKVYKGVLSILK